MGGNDLADNDRDAQMCSRQLWRGLPAHPGVPVLLGRVC